MPHLPLLTRRDLLRRGGLGMAWLGLAGVLGDAGLLNAADRRNDPVNPLAPKSPHFPGKAQRVVHLFMNGGPSHVDTFDPKPLLDKYPRQAAAVAEPAHRTQDRRRHALAVRVPALRQERHRGQRAVRPHGRLHRRHLRHPLDARRRAQSRAVADADELRRRPAAAAQHGRLGDLRPGQREPEPARLHRHVSRRLSHRRRRRTGARPSCPAPTRAPTSTRSTPTCAS